LAFPFFLISFLEILLQFVQGIELGAFIFGNPARVDLVQRHRIEVVQLFATTPDSGDEVRRLQNDEMLGYRLSRHVEQLAQPAERLAVFAAQLIEQLPAARIGECLENVVHDRVTIGNHMVACQFI
jgi:hypothetical protein